MTVCVATLCDVNTGNGAMIVGASDRMLTLGDVEFQPPSSKVGGISNSIMVMYAGDAAMHIEVYNDVARIVTERIRVDQQNWWLVKDVAELYAATYAAAVQKRAETHILKPLGLSTHLLLEQQGSLSDQVVAALVDRMIRFRLPDELHVIIGGIDPTGAHLWSVTNGDLRCHDSVGFVAVGMGANHANSTLMLAEWAPTQPLSVALLLTYAAKKRGEVAPGVGINTDMCIVGPKLGTYFQVRADVVDRLKSHYGDVWQIKETQGFQEAIAKTNAWVEEMAAQGSAQKKGATAEGATLPPERLSPPAPQPPPASKDGP